MNKIGDVNIKVRGDSNKELVKNIQAYCDLNNIAYSEFAVKVFSNFFDNERTKLELLSKEQLINVIMEWKKEELNAKE